MAEALPALGFSRMTSPSPFGTEAPTQPLAEAAPDPRPTPALSPPEGREQATGLSSRAEKRQMSQMRRTSRIVWAATAVALVIGIVLRLWLLFHRPVSSDEAVVGLMAQQILHGHLSAFYWGQNYGAVEPYVVAGAFAVFGKSTFVLTSVAGCLSALAGVLTWRVARRLVDSRPLAALTGALVWAAPVAAISNSMIEYGFRGVVLCCGLGALLLSLQILDGRRGLRTFALLGLVTGLGWWASPEVVYFLPPAAAFVVIGFLQDDEDRRLQRWGLGAAAAACAALLGALPWLWVNASSGWSSLQSGSFKVPPGSPGYFGRLHNFFEYTFPLLGGVRHLQSGTWSLGPAFASSVLAVEIVVVVGAVYLCLTGPVRAKVIAGALVVSPFLLVASPATWFWEDGRYACLLAPLVALTLITAVPELNRRLRLRRAAGTGLGRRAGSGVGEVVLVGFVGLSALLALAGFHALMPTVSPGGSFFTGWSNPNAPAAQSIATLEADGVHDGYAEYWVAYKLDYMSDQGLKITTVAGDVNRWRAQQVQIRHAPTQAWLFAPLTPAAFDEFAKTTLIQGPGGLGEAEFVHELDALHIGYRVVDAGLIQAVIPAHSVTPTQVGIPGDA